MSTTIIRLSRPEQANKTTKGEELPFYPLTDHALLSAEYLDPIRARVGIPDSEPDIIVRIHAASLNHRDLSIRQGLYPEISDQAAFCSDGAGIVYDHGIKAFKDNEIDPKYLDLKRKRVIIYPGHNWISRRSGPESWTAPNQFSITGGSDSSPFHGTLGTSVQMPASYLVIAPEHLSAAESACLPIAGLTAWRAVSTKLKDLDEEAKEEGRTMRVLVTGIGGGVALFAMQFAAAKGYEVWVTSSSEVKIDRAVREGATGGQQYTALDWVESIKKKVKAYHTPQPDDLASTAEPVAGPISSTTEFDAIIDSSGSQSLTKSAVQLLRPGGVIVQYGMTASPYSIKWDMTAVRNNIELRGCTMGSLREFREMIEFVGEHEIVPIVDQVLNVLEDSDPIGGNVCGDESVSGSALGRAILQIDQLFEKMKKGDQFGKLVIQIERPERWTSLAHTS